MHEHLNNRQLVGHFKQSAVSNEPCIMLAMNVGYDEVRYQVFVSSTFSDLKDERAKVLQAILECKAFPSGMELFPSANDEQFEFIKREIDSSDYYIVLIAGRYGSLSGDGISYTEKEFDYALSQGKPILAFLVRDPSELPVKKCEPEAKNKLKLEQFRERAKASRVVSHYENPDDLKSAVLHSLNYQFKINPQRGWTPAGHSKREDLEEIRALLNKVLNLESENADLKSFREGATARLGQGEDKVSWTVDVTELVWSERAREAGSPSNLPFPLGETELLTTWDELLKSLYYSASSRLDAKDVGPRLFYLLASKISDQELRARWLIHARRNLTTRELDLNCLRQARGDIYRQFTGLGLIEEIVETRYEEAEADLSLQYILSGSASLSQRKQDPIPVQIVMWRLTRRGEEQLALIRGFRRGEPS
jgi:Domain of unknown function (DUF4062)